MNCGHWGNLARRKLGALPEGFEFFEIRATKWGTMLKGGVATVTKSGKNKGRKRWGGPHLTAIVTDEEYQAELARYERETGNCHECLGEKQTVAGWHHQTGWSYRTCHRCKGSGKAPESRT